MREFKALYDTLRPHLCWLLNHSWLMPKNSYNRVCGYCGKRQHRPVYDVTKWVDVIKKIKP